MRVKLILLVLLAFSTAALAVDGVLEINQSCAVGSGCFAGDAAGYPVTIGLTGSYRLTGTLDLRGEPSPENVTAIRITADLVQLDLNGFALIGPVVCSADLSVCAPEGSGVGVLSTSSHTTVRNGSVAGFGATGLELGDYASVRQVDAIGNAGTGIRVGEGANVAGSHAVGNGSDGIEAGAGSRIVGNSASGNGGFGLQLAEGVGYATNVLSDNNGGSANPQISAPNSSIELGGNACGSMACPVCGDASCTAAEDCASCPEDCGDCPPLPTKPEIYTDDRTLSPLTPHVVDNLLTIAAASSSAADGVFAKVGSSETVSSNFLHCFSNGPVDLAGRTELQATIDSFLFGDADGTDPFVRQSEATGIGRTAQWVLAGDPSPLDMELTAIVPRFAVIHFGSSDIDIGNEFSFGERLLDIVDVLVAQGVVPVFTSVPPRDDSPTAGEQVPRFNAIVRAVAQARQVPFIDYHRELIGLVDHGLGADGVHPSVYSLGACRFTAEGLTYGYNIRNLITIQMLDRLRLTVVEEEGAPDVETTVIQGVGTQSDPLLIDRLPFSDVRNTQDSPERNIDTYSGCTPVSDESGPEITYRFELTQTTTVRGMVIDRDDTDIDVHLLSGSLDGSACIARGHQFVTATLAPGTYYFVLDTFVSDATERSGEYVFALIEE